MPDFERIDRELSAIGAVPEAVQPLLDLYGQRDRSLENVDVVLAALREGRDPASGPPGPVIERPSFLPLGWDAERKSDPGMAPAPIPVAVVPQEEITVTTGLPDDMEPPASEPPAAPAAPMFVESEAPAAIVSAAPEDRSEPIDTQESFPPPPAEDPLPPVASAAPEADSESDALAEPKHPNRASRPPRADIQALLDTELDPREFPSTNPPANLSRSSLPPTSLPPVPRSSLTPNAAPSAPAAQDADFELLVDDDDIMEIDEESE